MSSMTPRGSFSLSAGSKLAAVAVGVGVLLLVSAPAALAACPPTDPLCVTDEASDLRDLPPPTAPPVDEVQGPVEDAVDSAKGEVDKAVGGVTDAVDDLLNPGSEDPGGGGDGDGDGDGSPDPSGGPDEGAVTDGPTGSSTGPSFPAGSAPGPATVPTVRAVEDRPGVFGRIGGAATEVAKQLGFPLALAIVVLAFAAVQNYLDRRDPKLALAPIRPEVMRFE